MAAVNSFLSSLDAYRLGSWLALHGKKVLMAIAVLVFILFLAVRLSLGSYKQYEAVYQHADQQMTAFQKEQGQLQQQAFLQLTQLLKKEPYLHAKYGAPLAQLWLSQKLDHNEFAEVQSLALAALERTKKNDLPFYTDFSTTTLLIAQGEYRKAQEQTEKLKDALIASAKEAQELGKPRSFGDLLFAYTLLRLAFLYQELGNLASEEAMWIELKQYAGLSDQLPPTNLFSKESFKQLYALFQEGKISFKEYVDHRREERSI